MRASQIIPTSKTYRLTPAQRRLSAGATGSAGLRKDARRSVMPAARKADLVAAITGSLLIITLIAGLMSF